MPSGSSSPSKPAGDPFIEQLQNDFNFGQPFDMSLYTPKIAQLEGMGFGVHDALEALCITENKSVEAAMELLLDDKAAIKKKRAEAVKAWLVKNGVAADRLTAEGFGDKKPVAKNDSEEGRAKNRRVELVKL